MGKFSSRRTLALAVIGALVGSFAAVSDASAGSRYAKRYGHGSLAFGGYHHNGMVTAYSKTDFRRLTAPTRRTATGYEVRLPGGTWMPCQISCVYTLQKERLDFWEDQTNKGLGTGSLGRVLGFD